MVVVFRIPAWRNGTKKKTRLEQNIHPTLIVSGYRKAAEKAMEVLDSISEAVEVADKETLKKVAITSISSKGVGSAREHFADIAIEAVKQTAEKRGERCSKQLLPLEQN